MFTGLIQATGEVISFTRTAGAARLTIAAPAVAPRLRIGDSVAVSGVCLTALAIEPQAFPPRFSADLAADTIARTTLSRLAPGSVVNLELPTPAGSPLGGHVVQGHVDATGTLLSLDPISASMPGDQTTDWLLRLRLPDSLTRYVVEKGSITVEGISLTVAAIVGGDVTIAIIPHTYAATNLHTLTSGMGLNIEVDVLAKYAERLAQARLANAQPHHRELTVEFLLANGY
jgi:riboflavin synthase